MEDTGSVTWSASRVNSINAKEWDIPYESLTFVEKIGAGRFSEGKIFTQQLPNCQPIQNIPRWNSIKYRIWFFIQLLT